MSRALRELPVHSGESTRFLVVAGKAIVHGACCSKAPVHCKQLELKCCACMHAVC